MSLEPAAVHVLTGKGYLSFPPNVMANEILRHCKAMCIADMSTGVRYTAQSPVPAGLYNLVGAGSDAMPSFHTLLPPNDGTSVTAHVVMNVTTFPKHVLSNEAERLCRVHDATGKPSLGFHVRESYFDLSNQLHSFKARVETLEQQNMMLQERCSTLEQQNMMLQGRCSTLEQQNMMLQGRCSTLEQQKMMLQGRCSTLEQQNMLFQAQILELMPQRQLHEKVLVRAERTMREYLEQRQSHSPTVDNKQTCAICYNNFGPHRMASTACCNGNVCVSCFAFLRPVGGHILCPCCRAELE